MVVVLSLWMKLNAFECLKKILCCYAVHSNTVRVGKILKCDPSSIVSWRAALKFENYGGVNSNK